MKTARRPAAADDRLATALARAGHAERQLDLARTGLQRLANGSNDVLARAARKLLRTLAEVK